MEGPNSGKETVDLANPVWMWGRGMQDQREKVSYG